MLLDEKTQRELRDKYNPEGSELRSIQLCLLEGLCHLDNICKLNGIKYWLSSGTCLGAIRHGGFIPWDDDIDIEMLREDYLKLLKLWKEDDHYVLQTYKNDLYYTQPFPKLRLKGIIVKEGLGIADRNYKYKGLFIDIFVMESSPRILATFCHVLVGSMRHLGYGIRKRNLAIDAAYWVIKHFIYGIIAITRPLCIFSNRNTMRHALGTGLERNIRMKDEVFPLKTAIFEGHSFPVPGNYDSYLKRMFGDYLTMPSKIHTHSLRSSSNVLG